MKWRVLAVAFATSAVLACSSFGAGEEDVGGVGADAGDGSAPAADGGGGSDAGDEGSNQGGSCGTVMLAGSNVTTGPTFKEDEIATTSADAYGYVAGGGTATAARCAHVFLASIAGANAKVEVGVYLDDLEGPGKLVSSAVIEAPIVGWNAVALNAPVILGLDQKIWLAISPRQQTVKIRADSSCSNAFGQVKFHTEKEVMTSLPSFWSTTGTAVLCNAAVWLSD